MFMENTLQNALIDSYVSIEGLYMWNTTRVLRYVAVHEASQYKKNDAEKAPWNASV